MLDGELNGYRIFLLDNDRIFLLGNENILDLSKGSGLATL